MNLAFELKKLVPEWRGRVEDGVVVTEEGVEAPAPEQIDQAEAALVVSLQIQDLKIRLADLDKFVRRAEEEIFSTVTPSAFIAGKIAEKQAIRSQLQALGA